MHHMDEDVNPCLSGTNRDNVPRKALEDESRWKRDIRRDAVLVWLCMVSLS
jgi:hypothetical protein